MAGLRDLIKNPEEEGQIARGFALARAKDANSPDMAAGAAGITAAGVGAKVGGWGKSVVDATKAAYGGLRDAFVNGTPVPQPAPQPAPEPIVSEVQGPARPTIDVDRAGNAQVRGAAVRPELPAGMQYNRGPASAAPDRFAGVSRTGVDPTADPLAEYGGGPKSTTDIAKPGRMARIGNAVKGGLRAAAPVLNAAGKIAGGAAAAGGAYTGLSEGLKPVQDAVASMAAMRGGMMPDYQVESAVAMNDDPIQKAIRGALGSPEFEPNPATYLGNKDSGGTPTATLDKEIGAGGKNNAVFRGLRGLGVPQAEAELGGDMATRFAGFANRLSGGVLDLFSAPDGRQPFSPNGIRQPETAPKPAAKPAAQPVDKVPTVRGMPVTADEMMNGSWKDENGQPHAYIPAPGEGAFQRTTPGNRGPAMRVIPNSVGPQSLRSAPVQPQFSNPGAAAHYADVMFKGQQYERNAAAKDAERGIRQKQADLAARKYGDERGDVNRKKFEENVKSEAEGMVTTTDNRITGASRAQDVAKKAAEMKNLFELSAADRPDKKKIEDMSPAEHQQLFQAYRNKVAVEAARPDFGQWLRDYTGNKRVDSRNVYSYMPASVEPSAVTMGKYKVNMANGNTIGIQALGGGKFVWDGPNTPVDAQMMEQIAPLIRDYEAKQKGKK